MNNIYVGVFLSLFCVCLSYCFLPTFVLVTVICLILACSFLKDDIPFYHNVATHVAWLYHKICEIYCNIENMYSKRDNSTNFPYCEQSQNGTITNNLDKMPLRYQSGSHNLGSPHLLKTSSMNTNSWISNNNVNLRQVYHTSQQNSIVNYTSPSTNSLKDESFDSSRQYANSSMFMGISTQTPRSSTNSHNCNSSSESISRTSSKTAKALDARLYANVNSPGFCSRVAEHLTETMTHQPKYDTVGAFPVVHLKSNPSKIKIKTPVRVRLTPRTNDLSYSSVGTNSMTRSPLSGADESMKSVLQVLKEISRKRIHSNVEEDAEDTTKRLRVNDVQYNSDGVLHATLLQQTIQGKRAREETSPVEDDVKKRRKPLKNNEITSSLSSSLSIKPPHLKTTKRKAPDVDDSVSPTPTIGKQLKIQTEVTPPLPRAPVISSDSLTNQECEVQNTSANSPRIHAVIEDEKAQQVTKEHKVTSSEAMSLSENDDDKVVSRLLGRMSSPVDDTCLLEIPVKKNVFMSTNDLSLSPPKENRLAAMIAVLGGPSEHLDEVSTDSETVKQPERNLTAKVLFTSPATPETPKQPKKVTFANALTKTKIYDIDKCASNENLDKEQTSISSKPFSIDFELSAFSPGATESVKQSSDTDVSVHSTTSASPLVAQLSPKSTISSTNNSSPTLTFLANTSHSENSKPPPAFSFGAISSPGQINKEKSPTQFSSVHLSNSKPISFGSESKTLTPTGSTAFGSQSIFGKTNAENESSKSAASPALHKTPGQFTLFNNDNLLTNNSKNEVNNGIEGMKNNQLVNGFAPNIVTKSTSPFSFSASVSQASSSKPLFPSLNQQLNGPTPTTVTFDFGSSTSVTSKSSIPETVSLLPAQNVFATSAIQPPQSNNIFSNVTNNQLKSSPFSKATQETSQSSTAFNTGTGQSGNLFNAKSASDKNSGASESTLFANNAFGTHVNDSKVIENSTTTQTNSFFGNSSNSTIAKLNPLPGTSSQSASQSSLGFPAITSTSQSNVGPFGGPTNNMSSQPSSLFGGLSTTTKSSIVFGSTTSANTSAQIGSSFSTSTANSSQSSIFSSSGVTQASKSIFSSSIPTTSFGIQNKSSAPVFGNQNGSNIASTKNQSNTAPPVFGSQTINSNFVNQNNTNTFSFGNTNTSNATQSGFGGSGTFNLNASSSSSSEVKPSTFMFGSSTTSANKELGKPFATPSQFSFGTTSQQTNQTLSNPAQSTLPTFGTTSAGFGTGQQIPSFSAGMSQPATPTFSAGVSQLATPTFSTGVSQLAPPSFSAGISQPATPSFSAGMSQPSTPSFSAGMSQPAPPSFSAGISQPAAPAFNSVLSQPAAPVFGAGISNPAAPAFSGGLSQPTGSTFSAGISQQSTGAFAFGQQSSAGPTFQFNATAPQPVQGGMFSIGSGGSSAPRSKTGALRRRHKLT